MPRRSVVVGGGIAGIYAALLSRRAGAEVVLVEAEPRLGGLLNSWTNEHGDSFDYGTHFIAGTEDPAIDATILPRAWTDAWQRFPNERAGNVFAGRLAPDCIFVDARGLPRESYCRAMTELLEAPGATGRETDLDAQLRAEYGPTLTDELYAPSLRKLFGVPLAQLAPDAHLRFAMKRLVAFSPETAARLKTLPEFDRRLAFHHYATGAAARPQYYPHEGGAGVWVERLAQALREQGVELALGRRVTAVAAEGRRITGVTLDDGAAIDADELLWTTPLPPLLRMAGLPLAGGPPALRRTVVVNLVLDRPPRPACHFFFNYDPDFTAFRVTLYSNMQPEQAERTGRHRVTIEILCDPGDARLAEFVDAAPGELAALGVFPAGTAVLWSSAFEIPNGFPVLSPAFAAARGQLIATARAAYQNLVLLGRTNTDAWFMVDVFRDVHARCAR